jgi:hypothetical protein
VGCKYLLSILTNGVKRLNEFEIFVLVLATLCHDFDHLDFTNAFIVVVSDSIALWYNDKVVLESHHVVATFLTMKVITCLS